MEYVEIRMHNLIIRLPEFPERRPRAAARVVVDVLDPKFLRRLRDNLDEMVATIIMKPQRELTEILRATFAEAIAAKAANDLAEMAETGWEKSGLEKGSLALTGSILLHVPAEAIAAKIGTDGHDVVDVLGDDEGDGLSDENSYDVMFIYERRYAWNYYPAESMNFLDGLDEVA